MDNRKIEIKDLLNQSKEVFSNIKETQIEPEQAFEQAKDLLESFKGIDKGFDSLIDSILSDKKIEDNEFKQIENKLESLQEKELSNVDQSKIESIKTNILVIKAKLKNLKAEINPKKQLIFQVDKLEKKIINGLGPFKFLGDWIVKPFFDWQRKLLNGEKLNMLQKFMMPLMLGFMGLILTFTGYEKEFKNLYNKLKNFVDKGFLDKYDPTNPEFLDEKEKMIKTVEDTVRQNIKDMLKRMKGINISDEELDKLLKEIDIKGFFSENTEEMRKVYEVIIEKKRNPEANYGYAAIEGLILPFKLFVKIYAVLNEYGYVSLTDLGVNMIDKSVNLFIGGFGLLGTNIEYITGKTNKETLINYISELLETSPDVAKQILAILLYRHGGLVFSLASNITKWFGNTIIYTLSGETKFLETLKNSYKGNIDEYIKVLYSINEKVKLSSDLKIDGIKNIFSSTVKNLEAVNEAVKILNEKGEEKLVEIIKSGDNKILNAFFSDIDKQDLTKDTIRSKLHEKISSIGTGLDEKIKWWRAEFSKNFKGLLGAEGLMDDFSKNIKAVSNNLANIVLNDSLWRRFKANVSKINLMNNVVEVDFLYDRAIYKFENVNDFKKFVGNLKILAKQSPNVLGFMFDKMPIFMVSGLIASGEKSYLTIAKELAYLVPIVGTGFLLIDSLYVEQGNLQQASMSGILLVSETGYILYKLKKGDFMAIGKFLAKPFIDIVEILGFLSRSGLVATKTTIDIFKLIGTGKFSLESLKSILKNVDLPKLSGRALIVALILLAGYGIYEYLSDEELDFVKDCKQNGQIDYICMDRKIFEGWKDLDNDTKASIIATAFGIRLNSINGVYGEFKDGKYIIGFNENLGFIPNYDKLTSIKNQILNILKRYESSENVNIEFSLSSGLVKSFYEKYKKEGDFNKDEFKKMLMAMGYSESLVDKFTEKIS